jgi:hypothetical protein
MDLATAAGARATRRDSHESAVGRLEQLAGEGLSDTTLRYYATAGSGQMRQSGARDQETAASQSTRYALGYMMLRLAFGP